MSASARSYYQQILASFSEELKTFCFDFPFYVEHAQGKTPPPARNDIVLSFFRAASERHLYLRLLFLPVEELRLCIA